MTKQGLLKLSGLCSFDSFARKSLRLGGFATIGLAFALFTTLFACSGTVDTTADGGGEALLGDNQTTGLESPAESRSTNGTVSKDILSNRIDPESGQPLASSPAKTGTAKGPQGNQGDVQKQRREFLIRDSLKKARRNFDLKQWNDTLKACADVLLLDPNQSEALDLMQKAQAFAGERSASVGQTAQDALRRAEIEKQRATIQARDFERSGDFLTSKGDYLKAQRAFERALLTIRYSPWFEAGSEQERRLVAKAKQASKSYDSEMRRRTEQQRKETRKTLAEAERAERNRIRSTVRSLFEKANLAFQNRHYGQSVELLDRALQLDPLSQSAKDLRELAMRARHDQNLDSVKRSWRREWVKTFKDLEYSDVIQTESIQIDPAHWAKVNQRKPLEFTNWSNEEDPDNLAVLKTLESTRITSNFPETTIEEWSEYYRRATGVTFLVSSALGELDESETSLSKFLLPKSSVKQALDLISKIRPIQWKVKDGVVHLLSKEEKSGNYVPRIYDVREIINPISQYPGRDLAQKFGEESEGEEPPEPTPAVVDIDMLQTLINSNIQPDSWEEPASISPTATALVINQTPEIHRQIQKLLDDLRRSSGIQVDIESRFLRVEDNFLEEIGVDFRGLGNQASSGVPGKGLQKQGDRAGLGFDDYGRNTSPSAPSAVGTGFEPGIFYNDGGDGDLFGRTENLFDRALGGGDAGLNNAGGLSFQWTYLDDTELEVILRAVSKQERVEELSAPRLLIHNTARANLTVTNQFTYIKDFNVEIAQAAAIADPVVDVIRDGVVLDVRPVVSADRKYILMELRPTLANLTQPIPTFTTSLGAGQPVSIQLPELQIQRVRTTVTIPDGGTLLLGGMRQMQKQRYNSGIPILRDIPGLSFLFSRKGTYNENRRILILLRASVIVPSEWEPALTGTR